MMFQWNNLNLRYKYILKTQCVSLNVVLDKIQIVDHIHFGGTGKPIYIVKVYTMNMHSPTVPRVLVYQSKPSECHLACAYVQGKQYVGTSLVIAPSTSHQGHFRYKHTISKKCCALEKLPAKNNLLTNYRVLLLLQKGILFQNHPT